LDCAIPLPDVLTLRSRTRLCFSYIYICPGKRFAGGHFASLLSIW